METKKFNAESVAAWMIIGIMAVMIFVLGYRIKELQGALEDVNTQAQMQQEVHSQQIEALSTDISTVKDDMQTQIDDQQEQLDKQKTVQHNTNQALIRANKQINEKESEIQELREGLKK